MRNSPDSDLLWLAGEMNSSLNLYYKFPNFISLARGRSNKSPDLFSFLRPSSFHSLSSISKYDHSPIFANGRSEPRKDQIVGHDGSDPSSSQNYAKQENRIKLYFILENF